MTFENFISYKRKNSKLEVKTIYDELMKKGLSTFYDVYFLGSCNFDEKLKHNIASCTNFFVNFENWFFRRNKSRRLDV